MHKSISMLFLIGLLLLLAAQVTVHKLMSNVAVIWPTLPFFFLAGLRPPTVEAGRPLLLAAADAPAGVPVAVV